MFTLLLSLAFVLTPSYNPAPVLQALSAPTQDAMMPALLAPEQTDKLLPPTVFFRGQSAPLQLRNASAARFGDGAILFASLVDTSGYSTSVRERYQFYFVTEIPILVGDKPLPAGAYGAGFLDDGTFVVMDIGGHDVLLAHTIRDQEMRRPRPLQLVPGAVSGELRLYLGRSYATLRRASR